MREARTRQKHKERKTLSQIAFFSRRFLSIFSFSNSMGILTPEPDHES
jgi:hypothetical protein